ncbi:MAG: hypothetical protein M1827_004230 [Pycnora praestabilis]|nr:MAG: hypothetical protein M1827_004230 [Pycnora praestabilis]
MNGYQAPQNQSSVYQPVGSGWQDNPLQHPQLSLNPSFGNPVGDYGRSFSHSPASFNHPNFVPHPGHSFSASPYGTPTAFDPSLASNGRGFGLPIDPDLSRSSTHGATISPHALQSNPNQFELGSGVNPITQSQNQRVSGHLPEKKLSVHPQNVESAQSLVDKPATLPVIPAGTVSGVFIQKNLTQLAKSTDSEVLGNYLVTIGKRPTELGTTKTTLPKYISRKSRNDLKSSLPNGKVPPITGSYRPPAKKIKVSTLKQPSHRATNSSSLSRHGVGIKVEQSSESSSEASEDDSDYASSEDEELDIEESSPLPTSRPADPVGAVEYDAIKALFLRGTQAAAEQIRFGLGEYWNIIKDIRDTWKSDSIALKEAEDKKNETDFQRLKHQVSEQRRKVEVVIKAALDKGHQDIVERLGENASLIYVLQLFLSDRIKESDLNGSLTMSILELMSRCITLEESVLEKTRIDKLLARLTKRGNDKTKVLVQKILSNAAIFTKQKSESAKAMKSSEVKEDSRIKAVPAGSRLSGSVNGLKRPRDIETQNEQPLKRVASNPNTASPGASGIVKSAGLLNKRVAATVSEAKPSPTTTLSTSVKPKANHVAARPTGFFSSLQSASKKPGTSNASLAIAQQKSASQSAQADKKDTIAPISAPTAAMAAPKQTFSFAETMANLTKPKEPEPTAKPVAKGPPETEDEKRKRLRKEERRKMRVTFKPEENLIEVRYFTHDPAEELDHEDSMVRDVGDVGGEGRMFKQHKDMDLMDEEEDGAAAETTMNIYKTPSLVDFSVIDPEELRRNYVTRGGYLSIESPEQLIQEKRELSTLMVIYTHPSDIPPSPREPSNPYSGEPSEIVMFGTPSELTTSRDIALRAEQNPQPSQVPQTIPTTELSALLSALNRPQPQQQPQPQQPAPQSQAPMTDLERIFAMHASGAQQAAQQAVPQPQMQQPPSTTVNLQALLAAMPRQDQSQAQPQAPPQVADLQAILAQLGQQQAAPQSSQFNFLNQFQRPPQSEQDDYDLNRASWQGGDGQMDYDDGGNRNGGGYGDNKNSKRFKAGKGEKKKPFKKYPCKFWQEGRCKKGDDCGFLHE